MRKMWDAFRLNLYIYKLLFECTLWLYRSERKVVQKEGPPIINYPPRDWSNSKKEVHIFFRTKKGAYFTHDRRRLDDMIVKAIIDGVDWYGKSIDRCDYVPHFFAQDIKNRKNIKFLREGRHRTAYRT